MERQDLPVDDGRHGFHLGEHFQARLGLRRFARLGAEAIDESLKVPALASCFFFCLSASACDSRRCRSKLALFAMLALGLGLMASPAAAAPFAYVANRDAHTPR
jgi:hypothetical protein